MDYWTKHCLLWTALLLACGRISADDNHNAKTYLKKYGYIDFPSGRSANQVTFDSAVRRFQDFAGLPVTGLLDAPTLAKMAQPRCGVKDIISTRPVNHRRFRRQLPGHDFGKWEHNRLTYRVVHHPGSMTKEASDEEINRAYRMWMNVANLTITQVEDHNINADMDVMFVQGDHGDHEPFDGPRGMLGHAFFPPFGGNTHFDDAEEWTSNRTEGVNLFQVATHEFGHALGLGHSKDHQALMAPFYQPFSSNFSLQEDDIVQIRRLYGARGLMSDDVLPENYKGPVLSSPLATTASLNTASDLMPTEQPPVTDASTNGTSFKPQTRWHFEGSPTVPYYPGGGSYGHSGYTYPSYDYGYYTPYPYGGPDYYGGYGYNYPVYPSNYYSYPPAQVPLYPVYPSYPATTKEPDTTTKSPVIIYLSPSPSPVYPPYVIFSPSPAPTPPAATPAPTPPPTQPPPTTTTTTTTTTRPPTTTSAPAPPATFYYFPGSGYGNYGQFVSGYPSYGGMGATVVTGVPNGFTQGFNGVSTGTTVVQGVPTGAVNVIQGTPTGFFPGAPGTTVIQGTPNGIVQATPGATVIQGTPNGAVQVTPGGTIIQGTPVAQATANQFLQGLPSVPVFRGSTGPMSLPVTIPPKSIFIEDPNGALQGRPEVTNLPSASEDAVQVKSEVDDSQNHLTEDPLVDSEVNTRADLCGIDTPDAVVSVSHGNTLIFKGPFYWVLDKTWQPGPQRHVSELSASLDHVDAAYYRSSQMLLFSGTSYYKFDVKGNELHPLPGYPKLISQGYPGMPDLPVDEVVKKGPQLWFFRDRDVTVYSPEKFPPIDPQTGFMKTSDLDGFPERITASFVDEDEHRASYVFHNRAAFRLTRSDSKLRASMRRFPRTVKEWLKCADFKRWHF